MYMMEFVRCFGVGLGLGLGLGLELGLELGPSYLAT